MLDFTDANPRLTPFMANGSGGYSAPAPQQRKLSFDEKLRLIEGRELLVLSAVGIVPPKRRDEKMRCPFPDHEDKDPSWRWEERQNRYFCSCYPTSGDVLDIIQRMGYASKASEALDWAVNWLGLQEPLKLKPQVSAPTAEPAPAVSKTLSMAQRRWNEAGPIAGTLAETYLRTGRGLNTISLSSNDMRFHQSLLCKEVDSSLPALIVLVRNCKLEPMGIQRIWIDPETGRRAAVKKKGAGIITGGAFHNAAPAEHMGIAEGPETAMSVQQIFGIPCAATLSAGNMQNFIPPEGVRKITIFADADKPDKKAVPKLIQKAVNALTESGLEISIMHPLVKEGDFNDDLRNGATAKDYQLAETPAAKKREKTRFPHLATARQTVEQIGAESVICTGSGIWTWNKGVWLQTPDRRIKQEIHLAATGRGAEPIEDLKKADVDSVLDLFKTETFRPDHAFNCASSDFVNVANGELFFDGQDWTLKPHCREHYSTSQIPITYDPTARAVRFERFLEEVFEGDSDAEAKIRCTVAMIGYCLLTTTRFERFFILIGRGSNGKSVLLAVIEALLGLRNVSAIQPDQFGNKFQRAHLLGKLANIVTEIKQGAVIDDAALKAIVSGELATAEQKFRDPFDFRPHATCLFGTNHMPATRDFSDAVFRRAVILKFNRQFTGALKDTKLKDKLMTELPGILNLALHGIAEAISDGDFAEPPSSETAKAEWRKENDQVQVFVEDLCTEAPGAWIGSTVLYERYRKWADSAGVERKLSQKGFTQRLCYRGIEAKHESKGNILYGIKIDQMKDMRDEPVKDV